MPGVVTEVIKNKMSGVKKKTGLKGDACQIPSSCSEYSLQHYCLLLITIDSY